MPANERRLWWCKHGHILGEIKKVAVHESRVRALMLYEQSVELDDVPPGLPALRGRVVGTMHDIRCTICGEIRDWIIGEDAIQELMGRLVRSER